MKKLTFMLVIACLLALPMAATAGGAGSVWYVPGDFATIQEAIDSSNVADGDTILVGPGSHAGAFVTKSVEIKGEDMTVIDSGPMHPAGLSQGFRLLAGSDGAVISHLQFEVDLAIMNGEAVNGVTVAKSTFVNTIQAISNWRGSGWTISHNDIIDLRTRNGGGIGIIIADYAATEGGVKDNIVSHNKISGVLHVDPNDGGGYQGSGIVLYADFRWGRLGAEEISNNYATHNKVSLISDTPGVVDVVAFELTDSRDDASLDPVIFDNAIGFNDFRGTVVGIVLTPESLEDINNISRNLGDSRGHGLHPSVFNPGN
jgi:hypothetical protein